MHFLTSLCCAYNDISSNRARSLTCARHFAIACFMAALSASDVGAASAGVGINATWLAALKRGVAAHKGLLSARHLTGRWARTAQASGE